MGSKKSIPSIVVVTGMPVLAMEAGDCGIVLKSIDST
jgi:hypothetical protein